MRKGLLAHLLVVGFFLSMLGGVAPLSIAEVPPGDGSAVTLSGDTNWSGELTLDGAVTIPQGVTLTIDGDVAVEDGSILTVAGNLLLSNGSLSAVNPPSDLQMWAGFGDEATLFLPEELGLFTISIHSAANYNLTNFTVRWNDGPDENMAGNNHTFVAGVVSGDGGFLYFNQIFGGYGELVIDRIEVTRVTTTNVYEATELDNVNWLMRGDAGFSLDVTTTGEVVSVNSTISGAEISIAGNFSASTTDILNSGPLLLSGEEGNLTMNDGSFSGSRDDHDVKADPDATITLNGVNGSGGIIDLWERQIETQTLFFPGSGITFNLTGVGPSGRTLMGHSMTDGTYVVPANYQAGPRVVEIGYADGTVWTEEARIEDVEWFTAWGTYFGANNSLAKVANVDVEFPILPDVAVTEISLVESAHIGTRADVIVTIVNNGLASASVPLECYVGSDRADISPTYPAAELGPQETATIEMKWGYGGSGNATLVCMPMTPSQLVQQDAFGSGNSELTANWVEKTEVSESGNALVISFLVALVVGLLLVFYFTAIRERDGEPRTITISVDDVSQLDDDLDDL